MVSYDSYLELLTMICATSQGSERNDDLATLCDLTETEMSVTQIVDSNFWFLNSIWCENVSRSFSHTRPITPKADVGACVRVH